MKEVIAKVLKKALKKVKINLNEEEIEKLIEIPPSQEMGDYSFPCFFLAEKLKQEPNQIALEIREKIGNPPVMDFEDVQTSGPYINFFLNRKDFARKLVWEVLTQKGKFGKINLGKRKKIIVEFSSPNIAKPFGIGHLRSTIIGNSIANICEFEGFKAIRMNYLGDWGAQFGKLLLGYEKFGSETKLQKNPMKHLLEIYVKINKSKRYEKKSKEWFKKLEEGDKKALMLWKVFKQLSLHDFKKIYKILGVKFDDYTGESSYSKRMKKIVEELKEKNLLKKSQGAEIVDLNEFGLGICLIEKTDGTTLYATRDISAAIARYKKYQFEKMIYEVGQEQNLYFRQVFKVLELAGYKWAKNCIHAGHGLYLGKDGKKFSTRKGKTVFIKDILEETISLAKKEIKKRFPSITKRKLEERALKIAIAAIFYGDLKNSRSNDIVFDIKRFISFEGDTGPYVQYSYARASSILKKTKNQDKFKVYDLEQKELELVKKLSQFPDIVLNSYKNLSPSIIANYSYQLAKIFNEFYHTCPVIGSKQESFRLALVEAFRQILKSALRLLGIDVIEEM
ncbi:arginine--tRNA ligase [Candidatus Pacearchaeota archaeon]|nr:arginine--tRNA ligase [Candidatus Pacearchaeota archaeon]